MSRSYGVDNAIPKVHYKIKNDIGLQYDRLKWRRRRGRVEPSLEILFKVVSQESSLLLIIKLEVVLIPNESLLFQCLIVLVKLGEEASVAMGFAY